MKNLVIEEWRDIEDHPDYKISNLGHVLSKKRHGVREGGE